jgi:hypothetical protein
MGTILRQARSPAPADARQSVAWQERLRSLLLANRLDQIGELAASRRRVLSYLTALTYDPDPMLSDRAVQAIGVAADRIAGGTPEGAEYVRTHLRRQMWLLSDESGGIGWRAPEIMGEIIYHRPKEFAEFIPIVISILDMEAEDVVRFRSGALAALGRLAQVLPLDSLQAAIPLILPCLQDEDARVREAARRCLDQGCFQGTVEHP